MIVKSKITKDTDGTFQATLSCSNPKGNRVDINLVSMKCKNRDAPVRNLCIELIRLSVQLKELSLSLENHYAQRTMEIEVDMAGNYENSK